MRNLSRLLSLAVTTGTLLCNSAAAESPDAQSVQEKLPTVRLALTDLYMNGGQHIMLGGGEPLMTRSRLTCSAYDEAICHNLSKMYRPRNLALGASFMYLLDEDRQINFGFDTGYDAQKITISPALWIGGNVRVWLDNRRSHAFLLSANYRFGSKVEHKPCYDAFNRAYFCGALVAWTDAQTERSPKMYMAFVGYQRSF